MAKPLVRFLFCVLALCSCFVLKAEQSADQLASAVQKGSHSALEELTSLAKKGRLAAQFNLAFLYQHGEGVPKNLKEALGWYTEAAESGHPSAQYNLSGMYLRGDAIKKDLVLAYVWRRLAEGKEDSKTASSAAIAEKMSRSELSKAKKLLKNWKPKK